MPTGGGGLPGAVVAFASFLAGALAACAEPSYAFNTLDAAAGLDGGMRFDAGDAARDAHREGDGHATGGHDAAADVRGDAARDAPWRQDAAADVAAEASADAGHHEAGERCADGFACVEAVPAGWIGPAALYEGAAAAPGCAGAYDVERFSGRGGMTSPAASCSACGCGGATGTTCATSLTDLGTGCGTNCDVGLSLPANACVQIPGSPAACQAPGVAFDGSPETGSAGTCAPSGGQPTGAAPSFSSVVESCAASKAPRHTGCTGTDVCAAVAPSAFTSGLCVSTSGDVACPAGSVYATKHVYYASLSDTRTCSACSCAANPCDGTIGFFADTGCGAGVGTIAPNGACAGPEPDMTAVAVMYEVSASCSPSGGAPSGAVAGTSPTTYCCAP